MEGNLNGADGRKWCSEGEAEVAEVERRVERERMAEEEELIKFLILRGLTSSDGLMVYSCM